MRNYLGRIGILNAAVTQEPTTPALEHHEKREEAEWDELGKKKQQKKKLRRATCSKVKIMEPQDFRDNSRNKRDEILFTQQRPYILGIEEIHEATTPIEPEVFLEEDPSPPEAEAIGDSNLWALLEGYMEVLWEAEARKPGLLVAIHRSVTHVLQSAGSGWYRVPLLPLRSTFTPSSCTMSPSFSYSRTVARDSVYKQCCQKKTSEVGVNTDPDVWIKLERMETLNPLDTEVLELEPTEADQDFGDGLGATETPPLTPMTLTPGDSITQLTPTHFLHQLTHIRQTNTHTLPTPVNTHTAMHTNILPVTAITIAITPTPASKTTQRIIQTTSQTAKQTVSRPPTPIITTTVGFNATDTPTSAHLAIHPGNHTDTHTPRTQQQNDLTEYSTNHRPTKKRGKRGRRRTRQPFCYQCRSRGHTFEECSSSPIDSFCQKCGCVGVTTEEEHQCPRRASTSNKSESSPRLRKKQVAVSPPLRSLLPVRASYRDTTEPSARYAPYELPQLYHHQDSRERFPLHDRRGQSCAEPCEIDQGQIMSAILDQLRLPADEVRREEGERRQQHAASWSDYQPHQPNWDYFPDSW